MHRQRLAILSFLGCLLLGVCGCSVESSRSVHVRTIYVEEAVGAPSPDLAQFADVIHDTSVRVFMSRGYVAAVEPTEADAFLRPVWLARPSAAGMPGGRATLRLTLVDRDGRQLHAVDLVADVPSGFLTKERLADLVRTKLGTLRL